MNLCIRFLVSSAGTMYYCIVSIKFASYLKSVSHMINIPRLLGLYGDNIGSPGLGSRAIGTEDFLAHS